MDDTPVGLATLELLLEALRGRLSLECPGTALIFFLVRGSIPMGLEKEDRRNFSRFLF